MMDTDALVRQRVAEYFTTGDYNCAMTVLKVLGEVFDVHLEAQVIAAGRCMPGAGGVEGLCGLVSGTLMFIGVWGAHHGVSRQTLRPISTSFSQGVQQRFGSILCRDLRLNGCSKLAVDVLNFTILHLSEQMDRILYRK